MPSEPVVYDDTYPAIAPENFSFKGEVALITGAGRGIGKATAIAFAQTGADVALLSRTKTELEETAAECEKFGVKTVVLPADMTDEEQVNAAVAKAEESLGPVTILVNNAGANRLGPFAYTKPAEWWRLMTVNVLGPITVTFPVLNSMRKHNKGVIINVASRAGVVTGGFSSAYSASKSALIRATGNIQQELIMEGKDGISLFSLHPGGVKTSMNEQASLIAPECDLIVPGTTERIMKFANSFHHEPTLTAHTCLFLASGKANKLKGRYLDVEQDVGDWVAHADEVIARDLNHLRVEFLAHRPDSALSRTFPASASK